MGNSVAPGLPLSRFKKRRLRVQLPVAGKHRRREEQNRERPETRPRKPRMRQPPDHVVVCASTNRFDNVAFPAKYVAEVIPFSFPAHFIFRIQRSMILVFLRISDNPRLALLWSAAGCRL